MDFETKQKIIHDHARLIYSKPPALNPRQSIESGPPSPTSGTVLNFGRVEEGIYRSSWPGVCNLEHLRSLGLKTIVTLVEGAYESEHIAFVREHSIQHFRILIPAHKDSSVVIPMESIAQTLKLLLNPANQPLLIHCNKGKHRTGCMIACYRKIHNWTMNEIITEYRNYSYPKSRDLDEAFIRSFNPDDAIAYIRAMKTCLMPIVYALPTPPTSDSEMGYSPEEEKKGISTP